MCLSFPNRTSQKKTTLMRNAEVNSAPTRNYPGWLVASTWIISILMIALTGFSLYQYFSGKSLLSFINMSSAPSTEVQTVSSMPEYSPDKTYESVERSTNPETILPAGVRNSTVTYEVASGDSLFGIAEEYEVEP